MIRREAPLQVAVKLFVARCIDCPHKFASHDRSAARTPWQHKYEADRGIMRSWPDCELALPHGRTFRCELKKPGTKRLDDPDQARMLAELNALGHPAAWVSSVVAYGECCERLRIPLTGNWRTVAQFFDQSVLANIRKQEAQKPKKAPSNIVKFRTVRHGPATPAQIRKAHAARRLP